MKKFINNMFCNKSGEVSHKRILGTIGFIALVATMVANSFYHKDIAPAPELVQAVEYLVISTIFGTVIEKFANKEK